MESTFLEQNKIKKTHKLSELDKVNIVNEYIKGENMHQIALKYNVTSASLSSILKVRGIKSRPPSVTRRKLAINENAFENLLDEATAYWLGFLMADGSIYKRKYGYSITLALQKRDKEHLQKFKEFLNAEHEIKELKECFRITIVSKKLAEQLIDLGVVPRKSYEDSMVPEILLKSKHFWRGVIDGDGFIGIYDRKAVLGLAGRYWLIYYFLYYCISVCPFILKNRICKIKDNFFGVRFSCNTAKFLILYFYKNSSIFLNRKKRIVEIIETLNYRPKRR